jgi:hypothetical protein
MMLLNPEDLPKLDDGEGEDGEKGVKVPLCKACRASLSKSADHTQIFLPGDEMDSDDELVCDASAYVTQNEVRSDRSSSL